MGKKVFRSLRGLAIGTVALALAPSSVFAQTDPTEDLPEVENAALIEATQACAAAQGDGAVEMAAIEARGWAERAMTDEQGETVDIPVRFFGRGASDALIVVPQAEGAPPVCIALGVVPQGEAAIPAIQSLFAETFGEGMVQGQQAIYGVDGTMIATNFETDEEQGLVAQIAVLPQQSGD